MPPELAADIDAGWELLSAACPDEDVPEWLYEHWFQAGGAPHMFPSPSAYAAVTALPQLFEGGWRVVRAGARHVEAAGPDGRVERLPAGGFALEPPMAHPVPGTPLLRLARTAQLVNGFWHIWSDGWRARAPDALVRLYLPLSRGAELEGARRVLRRAPPGGVWASKFLSGEHIGGRRDPALLYLPVGGEHQAWVAELLADLGGLLGGARVRCAQAFGGAWLAPDPNDGRSFGEAACHALADAWHACGGDRAGFVASAGAGLAPLLPHAALAA